MVRRTSELALLQGALMEKNLTLRGGQTPVQKYWTHLLKCIQVLQPAHAACSPGQRQSLILAVMLQEGSLNAEFVITHKLPLTEAAKGWVLAHAPAQPHPQQHLTAGVAAAMICLTGKWRGASRWCCCPRWLPTELSTELRQSAAKNCLPGTQQQGVAHRTFAAPQNSS